MSDSMFCMSNMHFILEEKKIICLYIHFHCSLLALSLSTNYLSLSTILTPRFLMPNRDFLQSFKKKIEKNKKMNTILILLIE